MKAELINKEGNLVKFDINIDAKEFDQAIDKAYKKTRSRYNVAGFRKGKAPRKVIELNYGKGVFFNDALDILLPEVYPQAVESLGLDVVSRPELDIKDIAEDGAVVLEASVYVRPEFEVENYFGVEVEKKAVEVTDEEVEAELKSLVERQSRQVVVESAIENGNIAVIDFKGLLDGVAFDGGTAEGYSLEIGSNTFIPGFEDQLVGHAAGEEFPINVTFPEDYPSEELAGKEVVFEVKVNEVKKKELPELNDEFVSDTTEFETVDELKADIRAKKLETYEKEAKVELQNAIVDKIADSVEIDIPASMIEDEIDRELENINMQLSYQGWTLENFAELSGQTIDEIRESRREEAKKNVKGALVISKIAQLENVEVTEEDVEKDLAEFASMYGVDIEKVKESLDADSKESIKSRLKSEKTLELLVEKAVIK